MYIVTLINRETEEVYTTRVYASSMMIAEYQASVISGGDEVVDILYESDVEGGL
jgi:hypothetical protein